MNPIRARRANVERNTVKVTFSIFTDMEIDPKKLEKALDTGNMSLDEAKRRLRGRVYRYLDEEFTDGGLFGEYTREFALDVKEALEDLDVLIDTEDDQ